MIDSFRGKYRWLSNYWLCEIRWNDRIYPSTEHAYQATKSVDPAEWERFVHLETPGLAKKEGSKLVPRPDWYEIRRDVMFNVNLRKFTHKDLRERLLATGDEELVEGNTWGDTYWGVCNGVGENQLGKVLMELREIFRRQP